MVRRVTFCFAILFASAAFGGFASNEVYIPSVGRGAGAGGSQFYTTVWLTNLSSSSSINFTFYFLKDGQPNISGVPSFTDSLAPGQTRMYENVIENTLGISNKFGAARITATGEIFVSARVYDQANPADNLGTTEGLFFSAVPKSFGISIGQSASCRASTRETLPKTCATTLISSRPRATGAPCTSRCSTPPAPRRDRPTLRWPLTGTSS